MDSLSEIRSARVLPSCGEMPGRGVSVSCSGCCCVQRWDRMSCLRAGRWVLVRNDRMLVSILCCWIVGDTCGGLVSKCLVMVCMILCVTSSVMRVLISSFALDVRDPSTPLIRCVAEPRILLGSDCLPNSDWVICWSLLWICVLYLFHYCSSSSCAIAGYASRSWISCC